MSLRLLGDARAMLKALEVETRHTESGYIERMARGRLLRPWVTVEARYRYLVRPPPGAFSAKTGPGVLNLRRDEVIIRTLCARLCSSIC